MVGSKYICSITQVADRERYILYINSIYPRLVRYVINGRYQIDNNGVENGVRPLALGRKNYMFCGNHQAAKRIAIIYSLSASFDTCLFVAKQIAVLTHIERPLGINFYAFGG
jgi:hypothetical protein